MAMYSIWLGSFPSESIFQQYVDRGRGRSPFEKDFGIKGCLFEWWFFTNDPKDVRSVVGGLNYSLQFADKAAEEAKKLGIGDRDANAVIACEDLKEGQDWRSAEERPVRFVGTFQFSKRGKIDPITAKDSAVPQVDHRGWISLWLGEFASKAELSKYFGGGRGVVGHEKSSFAADFGLEFDSDYVFCERSRKKYPEIADLVSGWPGSDVYLDAALDAAKQLRIKTANSIIAADQLNYAADGPFDTGNYVKRESKPKRGARMKFLGSFKYEHNSKRTRK